MILLYLNVFLPKFCVLSFNAIVGEWKYDKKEKDPRCESF